MGLATLKEYLSNWTLDGRTRGQVADTVLAIAEASVNLSEIVARGALSAKLGRVVARAGEVRRAEGSRRHRQRHDHRGVEGPARRCAGFRGSRTTDRISKRRATLGRHRSAGRLLERRCERLGRNDLLGSSASSVVDRRGGVSSAGFAPARGRLFRVWPANRIGADGRPRHADLHTR